jgi:hypothetical protein
MAMEAYKNAATFGIFFQNLTLILESTFREPIKRMVMACPKD